MAQPTPGSPTVSRPRIHPRLAGRKAGGPLTIVGAVLALLGFLAFLYFGQAGGGHLSSTPTKDVVVASHDLGLRAEVSPGDLTIAHFAVNDVPAGAFDNAGQVKGLVTAVPILKGQPLTTNVLAKSADLVSTTASNFLPIPSGYVALTIPTGEQQGVAGFIQPGDYISVIALVNFGGRAGNARTVFTNLHVIRVGMATAENMASGKAQIGNASSLTLVVTQCQGEFLDWFLANSSMKYTLESYHDYRPKSDSADASCATVDAAKGVTFNDVAARYPGIFN